MAVAAAGDQFVVVVIVLVLRVVDVEDIGDVLALGIRIPDLVERGADLREVRTEELQQEAMDDLEPSALNPPAALRCP